MQQRFGDVTRDSSRRRLSTSHAQIWFRRFRGIPMPETKKGDIAKMNADPETKEGGDDALDAFRDALVMEGGGFGFRQVNQFNPDLPAVAAWF